MPTKNTPPPTPDPGAAEAPAQLGASPLPEAEASAFEYTASYDTVYVAVPLTAHPADHGRPATVYAWPDGPPQDGRWAPTTKTPNQAADNAGPLNTEE